MGYDDIVGSLEAGKKADLVVLDKDLIEVDPHDINRCESSRSRAILDRSIFAREWISGASEDLCND
jgi:cytosine/adenosine deaminase-related metal-dependent hydrolase